VIVGRRHRFLFLRIGKTGTHSVEHALARHGESLPLSPEEFALFSKHIPAVHARDRVDPEVWEGSFKFAFVRNPWDWVISNLAFNRRKLPFTTPFDPQRRITAEQVLELRGFWRERYHRGITWEETITQRGKLVDRDGRMLVDFVGRLERIQEDFDEVCDRTGLPRARLPHLNRTRRRDYRFYYDDATRDLVGDLYREDVEAFSYRF
jgi:hypothetical protein